MNWKRFLRKLRNRPLERDAQPDSRLQGKKIFGIGLPKTGTTSLNSALQLLGFNSVHFPHDKTTVEELRRGQYRLSLLAHNDALTDVPIPAIFAQLDEAYPGSKFVLTVRGVEGWIESCRNAWFNKGDAVPKPGTMREYYRTLLYGCNAFHEGRFRWVYHTHALTVADHFSGEKASQLLVLDISDPLAWQKLCGFLEVEIPSVPFPYLNRHAQST